MPNLTEVKKIPLIHYKGDFIKIIHLEKPYGEYSDPLVKIEITHKNTKKISSVEIPYENLNELIEGLNKTKEVCESFIHIDFHAELESNTGGGQ